MKTASTETRKVRARRNILLILQLMVMFGTVAFLIVATIAGLEPSTSTFQEQYGTVLTSLGISLGLTSSLLLVVGHKVRNTLWMGCVLLASYLYGTTGLWVIFTLWCLDEYIIYPLYRHAQVKLTTNVEIDKRLEVAPTGAPSDPGVEETAGSAK